MTHSTPLRGIVFDLDGTLVDSLSVTFDAFNHGFITHGDRARTSEEIVSYFGPGEAEIFAQILGRSRAASAFLNFQEYMAAHLDQVPLHRGVGDLLEKLKSEGVPIAIFTGRGEKTTQTILKHLGIWDRFISVIAHEQVTRPKPSPEGLIKAIQSMKLDPRETAMIGDMAADILAAQSAGSIAGAALWDLMAKKEELEPHVSDTARHHWIDSPHDVWKLWQNLSS